MSGNDWETLSNHLWGDVPKLQYRWGTLKLSESSFASNLLVKIFLSSNPGFNPHLYIYITAKACPKLKSRYKGRVKAASNYIRNIEDFDDLLDPQILSCHFLGPKPYLFILQAIKKRREK